MAIKKHSLKVLKTDTIPAKNILLDERNPNHMTAQQMQALSTVVEKYGYAQEVWVNDNGDDTYTVIDGEHRMRMLTKQGITDIPCKIFKLDSDTDVRMLRQVANKLRGTHDKEKDKAEYQSIQEQNRLEEFAELLGKHVDEFETILADYQGTGEDAQEITADDTIESVTCPKCGYTW